MKFGTTTVQMVIVPNSGARLAFVGKVHISKIRGDRHPVFVHLPTIAIH